MKTLKTLSFTGKGKATLSVSNGRKSKLFALDFAKGTNARVALRGEQFHLDLTLEQNAEIYKMTAITERLQEVKDGD